MTTCGRFCNQTRYLILKHVLALVNQQDWCLLHFLYLISTLTLLILGTEIHSLTELRHSTKKEPPLQPIQKQKNLIIKPRIVQLAVPSSKLSMQKVTSNISSWIQRKQPGTHHLRLIIIAVVTVVAKVAAVTAKGIQMHGDAKSSSGCHVGYCNHRDLLHRLLFATLNTNLNSKLLIVKLCYN